MWVLLFVSHSNKRQGGEGDTRGKVKLKLTYENLGLTIINPISNSPSEENTVYILTDKHLIPFELSVFTFKCFHFPILLPLTAYKNVSCVKTVFLKSQTSFS